MVCLLQVTSKRQKWFKVWVKTCGLCFIFTPSNSYSPELSLYLPAQEWVTRFHISLSSYPSVTLCTLSAQIAAAKAEASEARSESAGLTRQNALLDAELRSARGQLAATHTSLDDALAQLASVVGSGGGGDDISVDRANLQTLRAQVCIRS